MSYWVLFFFADEDGKVTTGDGGSSPAYFGLTSEWPMGTDSAGRYSSKGEPPQNNPPLYRYRRLRGA
ncbi:unnamed protein product [Periconia digitata]|uniref:Uncharacterized protein n=1 Tax=Periconia digitata TaxID=1303443 RepID=A0A9W4UJ04_9PLEO|nr:unnamed protein product [Periconia digitata]